MKKSTFEDKVAKIHINLFFSIKVISINNILKINKIVIHVYVFYNYIL